MKRRPDSTSLWHCSLQVLYVAGYHSYIIVAIGQGVYADASKGAPLLFGAGAGENSVTSGSSFVLFRSRLPIGHLSLPGSLG